MISFRSLVLFFLAIFFSGLLVLLIDRLTDPKVESQPDFQVYTKKQALSDLDKIK